MSELKVEEEDTCIVSINYLLTTRRKRVTVLKQILAAPLNQPSNCVSSAMMSRT